MNILGDLRVQGRDLRCVHQIVFLHADLETADRDRLTREKEKKAE